jgi:predicted dehydrogenase
MTAPTLPDTLDVRPRFPAHYRPKIGIIGVGAIVRQAHLPAYRKYGVEVAAVYDIDPAKTGGVVEEFGVGRVAADVDDLLGDPTIEVVDIATFPDVRAPLIEQALAAGKHVLSQKPLATSVTTARHLIEVAARTGCRLAVNHNGRWAPSWRAATLLVNQGAIGRVVSVTHLLDRSFRWTIGTHFERVPHWAIYDYAVHWFDITRCWLEERRPLAVRGRDYRTPNQPPASLTPWGVTVEVIFDDGATAVIRSTGSEPAPSDGHPFFIVGTHGKIRGSVLGNDYVEAERGADRRQYELTGAWFPDGFAGTMGELCCAIAEDREPFNSARHNLPALQMTLAACRSAERDGEPVSIAEVDSTKP